MEINIRLADESILRGIIYSPGDKVRAGVILVHGLGEHIGRYDHWMRKFAANNIAFTGVDLPGHGRSDGKRGHIKSYKVTTEMLNILIGEYTRTFPGIPVFLYGHSLGGGIVADYIIRNKTKVRGAVISAPWLRLSFEPPKYKVILAGIMRNIYPALVQPSGLVADHLSHDRSVVEKYCSDPLVHDRISASLFYNAVSAGRRILKNTRGVNIPILLMHGSDDKITSPDASRELAAQIPGVRLKIWDGGYHEVHNEPFSDDVFNEVMSWMNNYI